MCCIPAPCRVGPSPVLKLFLWYGGPCVVYPRRSTFSGFRFSGSFPGFPDNLSPARRIDVDLYVLTGFLGDYFFPGALAPQAPVNVAYATWPTPRQAYAWQPGLRLAAGKQDRVFYTRCLPAVPASAGTGGQAVRVFCTRAWPQGGQGRLLSRIPGSSDPRPEICRKSVF